MYIREVAVESPYPKPFYPNFFRMRSSKKTGVGAGGLTSNSLPILLDEEG
jgi:hypothetical protein